MKKSIKVLFIAAFVLALIGGVLCVSAFAMGITAKDLTGMARNGLFSFDKWWDEDDVIYVERSTEHHSEHTANTAADKLVIDLDFGHLMIQSTDVDAVYIEAGPEDEKYFDLQIKDTMITVRSKEHSVFSGIHVPEATLYVPQNLGIKHIFLDVDAGECIIENAMNVQTLEVDLDAGAVKIQNMTANWLDLNCDAGRIVYAGEAVSGGEADVDAGKIELNLSGKQKNDYNYELDVDAGVLSINGHKYSGKERETFIRNNAKATWSLSCDAGKIEMNVNP